MEDNFSEKLLKWYKREYRKLPWRETEDPYKIWLSEIMCQQTQVATVIPYYLKFLETYPDIWSLAQAKEDDVYKLWEGLGYYSRAKRLMLCAREVCELYDGIFPSTYKDIVSLPGIGPYTAGAIMSIAYNIKEPAIDGNVMRVYSRLYNLTFDLSNAGVVKSFDAYVRNDLPEDVKHFNQALMELGARVCTPTSPKCNQCPIAEYCVAFEKGIQEQLPIKTKKLKKKHKNMAVILIENQGKYMLEKRGNEGLLANLWGLPALEVPVYEDGVIKDHINNYYGLQVEYQQTLVKKKHVFTHLIWDMTLYLYKAKKKVEIDDPKTVWVEATEFSSYPLPTAFAKLLKAL